MTNDYCSLHNHTVYSLMDSLIEPSDLFKRAKELGQKSIAVTDHATLAGAWDCLKSSKEHGVKLLMGCEFYFTEDLENQSERLRHVILIAKNHTGYKNLLLANKLANDKFVVGFNKVIPRIDWNVLEKCSEGLICTTACGSGILSRLINTRRIDQAKKEAKRLKDIFGDSLGLEIQPHALKRNASNYNDYEDQSIVNHWLIKIGKELGIRVIAATDAHYLYKKDSEAHDVMLAIGAGRPVGSNARLKYSPYNEFYVKSRQEVRDFFFRLYKEKADEFCDNTLYFSDLCEQPDWIDPKFSNPSGKELPKFNVSIQKNYLNFKNWLGGQSNKVKGLDEDASYLRYLCEEGISSKAQGDSLEYKSRLEEEYDVIEYHGFSSYMLIVADYINYCKRNNIPVGPGRGSVGGSMIAYLIGIHEADPIKYGLIFARFLNKYKTEFPDIDVDFASYGKEKVWEYIRDKYGVNHVAHVSNINTLTPKIFARDISRAFEYGGNPKKAVEIGTNIADSIPPDIKTIESALKEAPLFMEYANSPNYSELKRFSSFLDKKIKTWSTHAGGIVIGKRPLVEFVPIRRDKEGNVAIEYEKTRAEANGLVKMDVLGVSTLDIIDKTLELIKVSGAEVPTGHLDYDANDQKTYDLISSGNTFCVFQLGTSSGTIDLCKRLKPKCISDLALINALARPNARDIRKPFIDFRNTGKKVDLLHPSLKRAFESTYGFAVYEECLMYLAQDVAGWNMHEADRLRKLTKEKGKNPKRVADWREDFINGSVNNKGLDRALATRIWDEIVDKFQGYAFNKSHAVFYGFLGYQTAYLKAHFPLEFLTANLMHEVNSNAKIAKDNISKIKKEIRSLDVTILPPDVNDSDVSYKIIDRNTLLTGLDALKNMGKQAIPEILSKRPFCSFEDMMRKVDGRKVNLGSVQGLAACGCLDRFGISRKKAYLYSSDYKKKIQVWKKRHGPDETFPYPWPEDEVVGDWTIAEKCAMENYYIGEALSGGILDQYPGFFNRYASNFSLLEKKYSVGDSGNSRDKFYLDESDGVIQGVVRSIFEFKIKKETSKLYGELMAKMTLEDPYNNIISVTIFPQTLVAVKKRVRDFLGRRSKLEAGVAMHCSGSINWYEGSMSIVLDDILTCAPIPPMPKDRESRKVSLKTRTKRKPRVKVAKIDPDKVLEEIESELIEEGNVDVNCVDLI
jgi:DNA polymerase III subunit alpha